ncbi:MAG: antitoxin component YwqK of YwqJK toxin-antitoxin module [Flavobacteriales bacterium]|jgi:antitoxin component YwqK of YwqJK toxin-antitoxin module|tara:strand:- start:9570 stop:11153 length:1584 start_codon:yes stop_codon:yes gene_type:complete
MNKLFTLLFTAQLITSVLTAQNVLDAPFIFEKELSNEPRVKAIFDNWNFIDEVNRIMVDRKYQNFYPNSFLYAEQEYARIRCFKYIMINDFLKHESDSVLFKLDSISRNYVTNNGEEINKDSVRISIPKRIYDSANAKIYDYKDSIGTDVQKEESSFLKSLLKNQVKHSKTYIDSNNILKVSKNSYPPTFEAIGFQDLIISCLKNNSLTAYTSHEFPIYFSQNEINKILSQDDFNIIGIRLMEDYYLNPLTKQTSSFIVGLEVITNSKHLSGSAIWFYFPEIMWALKNKGNFENGIFYNYHSLFEKHHFEEKLESYKPLGTYAYSTSQLIDHDFSLSVLPHFFLAIEKEKTLRNEHYMSEFKIIGNKSGGTYNGEIKVLSPTNNLILKGNTKDSQIIGEYKFYHKNSKVKAILNYTNNEIEGIQKLFYNNRKLYAKYNINNYQLTYLERFYKNGKLLEKGSFTNGLIDDVWVYQIHSKDSISEKILFDNPQAEKHFQNRYFVYKIQYTQKKSHQCLQSICIKSEILD